ncbi:MAG: type II toxin-antitoxin system HicB family antitoxin [Magnetococcus sp. YQC-3]
MDNEGALDGYTVEIWKDDEGDWLACLLEMPSISAFGGSLEEAVGELGMAWAATKESYLANGEQVPVAPSRKRYSGQFNVRVPKTLHRRLAIEAVREGVSLNALVVSKLLAV